MKTADHFIPVKPAAASWLVLGGAGFVGRALLGELQQCGRGFAGAGRSAVSPPEIGGDDWRQVDVHDVPNLRSVLRALQPSVLLNAIGHPPGATGSSLRDFYVRSVTNILDAVQAEQPACRVVLLGSAAEYGNSPAAGSAETDALCPVTDYGRAKCEQFALADRFADRGLDVVTARLFNAIGPGQGNRQFVGALCERIRRGESPLRVGCANHVRDWIDVRDVARALTLLAGAVNPPRVVNVCSGTGRTVEEIASLVGRLANISIATRSAAVTPGMLWRSVGQSARLRSLDWQPRYRLTDTLADQWRESAV